MASTLPDERRELDWRLKIVHGHPENPDRYTFPEEFTPDLLGEEDVLVFDLAELTVEQRRVEYDIEAVIEAVEDTELPEETGRRVRQGR